ncbi:MAG: DUF4157 domain-containing protein [Cyclobacteriaceae bacterium]
MKILSETLIILLLLTFDVTSQKSLTNTVQFASVEQAQKFLAEEDDFTSSWSQFDIDSRMQKTGSSREALFDLINSQVRAWTEKEQKIIARALKRLDKQISETEVNLDLPDTIFFVKTTAKEEGEATAYTRGNYVVFKEGLSNKKERLDHLILHELFHVLTRHNSQFRAAMYEIIGFKMMNSVAYPNQILASRITNPDAPQTDAFIQLKSENDSSDYMMILYADKPYTSGRFFDYVNVGLLKLTASTPKEAYLTDDQPQILGMKDVTNFFEQVGKNTKYIIHPEEIMAENFALALSNKEDLPNPEITKSVIVKLKAGGYAD